MMDYAKIEAEMRLWRRDLRSFPQEYIDYHEALATAAIQELKDAGYKIHSQFMERDGWADGMRHLVLIVETRSGSLYKLYWKDSHSKGSWFEVSPGGGACPLDLANKMREAPCSGPKF